MKTISIICLIVGLYLVSFSPKSEAVLLGGAINIDKMLAPERILVKGKVIAMKGTTPFKVDRNNILDGNGMSFYESAIAVESIIRGSYSFNEFRVKYLALPLEDAHMISPYHEYYPKVGKTVIFSLKANKDYFEYPQLQKYDDYIVMDSFVFTTISTGIREKIYRELGYKNIEKEAVIRLAKDYLKKNYTLSQINSFIFSAELIERAWHIKARSPWWKFWMRGNEACIEVRLIGGGARACR